jgi:hypothetical protein
VQCWHICAEVRANDGGIITDSEAELTSSAPKTTAAWSSSRFSTETILGDLGIDTTAQFTCSNEKPMRQVDGIGLAAAQKT